MSTVRLGYFSHLQWAQQRCPSTAYKPQPIGRIFSSPEHYKPTSPKWLSLFKTSLSFSVGQSPNMLQCIRTSRLKPPSLRHQRKRDVLLNYFHLVVIHKTYLYFTYVAIPFF